MRFGAPPAPKSPAIIWSSQARSAASRQDLLRLKLATRTDRAVASEGRLYLLKAGTSTAST
eukprot:6795361-Pyramimonas_sp.AAC.1